MPNYISQLRVGEADYQIKAKQLSDDVNLKTVNLTSVVGSGNISTLQVSYESAEEAVCFSDGLTDASNLEG